MRQAGYKANPHLAYLQRESKLFVSVLAAGALGIFAAALYAFLMQEASAAELSLYLQDFFTNISQNGTDGGALFQTALRSGAMSFCFLFLGSFVMVLGLPLIWLFAAYRSFMHGFTLFLLLRLYGIRALLFFVFGMLPHDLLLVPAYLVFCVVCLRFSLDLLQERGRWKQRIVAFLGKALALFLLVLMGALLQAYAEPFLIKLIATLYI